jgi:hypothetical protein
MPHREDSDTTKFSIHRAYNVEFVSFLLHKEMRRLIFALQFGCTLSFSALRSCQFFFVQQTFSHKWCYFCSFSLAVCFCSLDENEAFVASAPPKMKGANYYPEDITTEEFEQFVKSNPSLESQARGFFHLLRRADGKLRVVPYSEEYKDLLTKAANHMNNAAATCSNASMANFLRKRAEAFLSNDYFDSDVAWMEVDEKSALDVTIGPYEVYRDEKFNSKASFESFLGLRDFDETNKLSRFSDALQDVENNLPIDTAYRNPSLGALSPIVVINLLFAAGDVGGPQTAAFNLPNDEKVVELKGSKRTMLKNVQEQKFEHILKPIAEIVIAPEQRKYISFNAFFTHILAHELMHGLVRSMSPRLVDFESLGLFSNMSSYGLFFCGRDLIRSSSLSPDSRFARRCRSYTLPWRRLRLILLVFLRCSISSREAWFPRSTRRRSTSLFWRARSALSDLD